MRTAVHSTSNKSVALFLAAWIRLAIGSGIEMLSKLKLIAKPQVYVQSISALEWAFPLSYWICEDERFYCLISRRGEQEVTIHELPRLGKN